MGIPRILRLCTLITFSSLLLSACTLPGWVPFSDDNNTGTALNTGEKAALHFFTNIPNYDTGISLQSGASYQLSITVLNNWIDGTIVRNKEQEKLDEKGFPNSLMPYEWMGMTRRSREHQWFELMLVQPNCKSASLKGISNLNLDEASGSYNFVAACDGKLTLFVNDSRGFYGNNVGYANIGLSRVN